MDWMGHSFDLRWSHVAPVITPQNGDVPLLQPDGATGVQPRRKTAHIPGPFGRSASPASGADDHRVSCANAHSGQFLPGIQIFRINGGPCFEIRNSLESGDIHQDSACHNAILQIQHGLPGRALGGNRLLGNSVVHLALVEHVPQ